MERELQTPPTQAPGSDFIWDTSKHRWVSPDDLISRLDKAGPPGPPPREGLEWKEETSRWIRPETEGGDQQVPVQEGPEENLESHVQGDFGSMMAALKDLDISGLELRTQASVHMARQYASSAGDEVADWNRKAHHDKKKGLIESGYILSKSSEEIDYVLERVDADSDVAQTLKQVQVAVRQKQQGLERLKDRVLQDEFGGQVKAIDRLVGDLAEKSGIDLESSGLSAIQDWLSQAQDIYSEGGMTPERLKDVDARLKDARRALYGAGRILNSDEYLATYRGSYTDVNKSYDAVSNALSGLIKNVPLNHMKRPDTEWNRAIVSGEVLEAPAMIDDSWGPEVKVGGEASEGIEAAANTVGIASRRIISNLKPEYQQTFKDIMDKANITAYDDSEWAGVIADTYQGRLGPDVEAHMVRGFASSKGIFVPASVQVKTVIHEIGHHIDRHSRLNRDASSGLYNAYWDKRDELNEDEDALKKSTITPYAATNEREYFAESFAYFLQDPVGLFYKDPEAYRVLSEEIFQ